MGATPALEEIPTAPARRRRRSPEASIFLVLVVIALLFEVLGWIVVGRTSWPTGNGCR